MTKTSPAARAAVSQPRIAVTVPSARSTQLRPGARRAARHAEGGDPAVAVEHDDRHRLEKAHPADPPSPPRQRPAPPLPGRIA